MAYFDIKEIKYTIKKSGFTTKLHHCGSISNHRPSSQFEANKMAEEWIKKKHPNCEITNLEVIIK